MREDEVREISSASRPWNMIPCQYHGNCSQAVSTFSDGVKRLQ